jgi:hypothetical protein
VQSLCRPRESVGELGGGGYLIGHSHPQQIWGQSKWMEGCVYVFLLQCYRRCGRSSQKPKNHLKPRSMAWLVACWCREVHLSAWVPLPPSVCLPTYLPTYLSACLPDNLHITKESGYKLSPEIPDNSIFVTPSITKRPVHLPTFISLVN